MSYEGFECRFGHGILNNGEIITDPEQHRLLAKRALLQLADYLTMNDELLKANTLLSYCRPWSLDDDRQVLSRLQDARDQVQFLSSPEALMEFLETTPDGFEDRFLDIFTQKITQGDRGEWMANAVTSENPATVLDVAAGWGDMSIYLAARGFQVTSIIPQKRNVEAIKKFAAERSYPLDVIRGTLESIDLGNRQFDVVIFGEILEHLLEDHKQLNRYASLAKKAIVITTPIGSCEGGFMPNSMWYRSNELQHVRAYSHKQFLSLIKSVKGFEPHGELVSLSTMKGRCGHSLDCFCVKLVRTKEAVNVDKAISPGGEAYQDREQVLEPQGR
jgi:ubiquinone/menaquinone biosynthesis C-methylase UbiE